MSGFIAMTVYAMYVPVYFCHLPTKIPIPSFYSGLVIHQTTQNGFTLINRSAAVTDGSSPSPEMRSSTEKKTTNNEPVQVA